MDLNFLGFLVIAKIPQLCLRLNLNTRKSKYTVNYKKLWRPWKVISAY
jgi:hypothetical protein